MGSGHNPKSDRYIINATELQNYYDIRHWFTTTATTANLGYKYVSTDANGKQAVSFVDGDSRSIASAVVTGGSPPSSFTYDNWSYTFYNDAGQVTATVAPKDVNTGSNAQPIATLFSYDNLGRLIETTSPDEGTSRFVYSTDGKIRFSENQEQRNATTKRFSYTNYDYLGRLVESGEYSSTSGGYVFEPHTTTTPATLSVLIIIDNNFTVPIESVTSSNYTGVSRMLDAARCTDYSYITYDMPGSGSPAAQSYLYGQISKTQNANATSWYSYDEDGLLVWLKQSIGGLGLKTIDYTYDYFGNVTQVAYQAGLPTQPDAFYHYYEYDINQRLTKVSTSFDGTNKTQQAKYLYYLHGPLKRVELGNKLQGIDYVYAIDGSLKSINHSDVAKDPGGDGGNGFGADVFGQTFNYYDNDYSGAGYSAGSFATTGLVNQYNGMIKAQSWFTPVDFPSSQKAYGYSYDNLNQLLDARGGTVSGAAGSYTVVLPDTEPYREGAISYDKNGNIQALLRRGKAGGIMANYTYSYTPSTNRLAHVNDGSNLLTSYGYNGIGQMTSQVEGSKTMNVAYNAYGLAKEVRDASNNLMATYSYDDRGNRIGKTAYTNGTASKATYYVSDAGGNTLAIYEQALPAGSPVLIEIPIYGTGRIGMYKPASATTFYEINDNLGNVRAVIGKPVSEGKLATYEAANLTTEQSNFLRMDNARRVQASLFDHTNGTSNGYSERLNGSANEKYGIARSIMVMPGDTIRLEVYGKYVDANSSNWTPALTSLMGQISSGAAGVVIDGVSYSSSTSTFPTWAVQSTAGSTGGPKAYLNWMIFDMDFTFVSAGYTRMSATPKEQGQDVAHERLYSPNIVISQPGLLYAYLSNEETTPVEVYFDDFKVTQVHSRVVAGADYYPFGLTMSDREITTEPYRFGYQGQFSEMDKATGWNVFDLRMYDARFGRWLSPDPYGQFASPYVAMGNNPVNGTDPDGGLCCANIAEVLANTEIMGLAEKAAAWAPRFADRLAFNTSNLVLGAGVAASETINTARSQARLESYQNPNISQLVNPPPSRISFDVEYTIASPKVDPMGGMLGNAVRAGRDPVGSAITNIMLTVGAPEMVAGKLAVGLFSSAPKVIVIGEGMTRVRTIGRQIGAKWYQSWGKNIPTDRMMNTAELERALARNKRWIERKIKKGYTIFDAGIDPTRSIRSPFYELEKELLKIHKYPVIKL